MAFQNLADKAENTMKFAITVEEKLDFDTVTNFDEVMADIREKLESLRDTPNRIENPIIYHLDVGKLNSKK